MRGIHRGLSGGALIAMAVATAPALRAQAAAGQDQNITVALNEAHAKFRSVNAEKNADYIPALAKVDPKIFGIALVTTDGKVYTAGDIKSEVSIQSISKVFTMAKVMEEQGPEAIEKTIGVNAPDLATMAATLASGGRNPVTKKQVMKAGNIPYVLAVMATAGLYDDTGKWLYHTGLPAKSGVGGGIIAVAPGKFGIAAISPPLDEAGNSVRAQQAIRDIVARLNANPYAAGSVVSR